MGEDTQDDYTRPSKRGQTLSLQNTLLHGLRCGEAQLYRLLQISSSLLQYIYNIGKYERNVLITKIYSLHGCTCLIGQRYRYISGNHVLVKDNCKYPSISGVYKGRERLAQAKSRTTIADYMRASLEHIYCTEIENTC